MKIDLFSSTCFSCENGDFGIEDMRPAIVVDFNKGIANVENTNKRNIYFVPIDKNFIVYKANGKDEESLCDALLICVRPQGKYDFYLIELKSKQKSKSIKGIEQLKTTIGILQNSYPSLPLCISKKLAYVANQQHPLFQFGMAEECERFRNQTGFRLVLCATISVK